jgi:hypothetical protein
MHLIIIIYHTNTSTTSVVCTVKYEYPKIHFKRCGKLFLAKSNIKESKITSITGLGRREVGE